MFGRGGGVRIVGRGGGVRKLGAAGKRSRRKAGTVIDACGLERASRSRRWRTTRRTMCAKSVLLNAGNRGLGKAPHVRGGRAYGARPSQGQAGKGGTPAQVQQRR